MVRVHVLYISGARGFIIKFHYISLYSDGKYNNSPCLRPLQVVQEVLQVLADPQVPEYHLFQLGLEVLSRPRIFFS